jgi:hypothetical protein
VPDSPIGWAPPERERRTVRLPEWLDEEITAVAKEKRSTPSALLADALGDAIEEGWTASKEPIAPGTPGAERVVALDPRFAEALDERLAKTGSGRTETEFSALTAAIAAYYIHHRLRRVSGEGVADEEPA